uniref:Immunoglobulin C1-set domain-containing protein n=1 Tax=Leptobrachium leishanense TaxID=445787 RepID=A0A8C5QER5_9ANUR
PVQQTHHGTHCMNARGKTLCAECRITISAQQTRPDPDYLDQGKCDCHFTNGTEREFVYFDIGKYIAKTERRKPVKSAVPNYDILHSVKISVTASVNDLYQYKHTIICNIFGFYPSGIEVKWFRNEQTTQVRYLGPHSDGDWTYHWGPSCLPVAPLHAGLWTL